MTNWRRPTRWWAELLLLGLVYGAYSGGRLLARGDVQLAVDHGLAILRFERGLSLDFESPLNRLFTAHAWLGVPADFVYASLHYLITPAVLVWIYHRRPGAYRTARTWLVSSTLLGLVGFALMPTCPPRLLHLAHGFNDTMAQYSAYGWWGAEASAPRGLGSFTNQYAAMPSLHVGWALWCGLLLWRYGRHPLLRAAGAAYPLLTTVVVMGTANHYFLDAVAGAGVMGVGLLIARGLDRLAARRAAATPAAPAPAEAVPGAGFRRASPIVGGGWETSAGELLPAQRPSADDDAPAAAR
ncbi:phosphatase PAP2 family protein [Streptomyces sp. NPDC006529]|uniref:phosphatase PAP2 family protein n=1 Tax=Streptomyces sp. NPDC006529 TaxID=3157177 RepID=UPI0033B9E0D7